MARASRLLALGALAISLCVVLLSSSGLEAKVPAPAQTSVQENLANAVALLVLSFIQAASALLPGLIVAFGISTLYSQRDRLSGKVRGGLVLLLLLGVAVLVTSRNLAAGEAPAQEQRTGGGAAKGAVLVKPHSGEETLMSDVATPLSPPSGPADGSEPGTPRPETQLLDFDSLDLAEEERGQPASAAIQKADWLDKELETGELQEIPGVLRPSCGFIDDVCYWQQFLSKASADEVAQPRPPVTKGGGVAWQWPQATPPQRQDAGDGDEALRAPKAEAPRKIVRAKNKPEAERAPSAAANGSAAKNKTEAERAPSAAANGSAARGERKEPAEAGPADDAEGVAKKAVPSGRKEVESVLDKVNRKATRTALWRERQEDSTEPGEEASSVPPASEAKSVPPVSKATRAPPASSTGQAGALAREIQRRKAIDAAVQKIQPRMQGDKSDPTVEVTVRHGYKDCSVKMQVPTTITMMQLKQSLVSLVGKGFVQKTRLVQRQGNLFSDYKDSRKLGDLRELHVLGLDISRAAAAAGGDAQKEEKAPVVPNPKNIYADVLVIVSIEGTRHEGDTAICVPENSTMRKVRQALSKKLRWPRVLHQGSLAYQEDEVFVRVAEDDPLKGRWWLWLVDIGEGGSDSSSDDAPEEPQRLPPLTMGPSQLKRWWEEAGNNFKNGKANESPRAALEKIAENAAIKATQNLVQHPGPGQLKQPGLLPAPAVVKAEAPANTAGESIRLRAQWVGRWVHGFRAHEWCDISRIRGGSTLFLSVVEATTGMFLQGRLVRNDEWYEAVLTLKGDKEERGTVRLRLLGNGSMRLSFRMPGPEQPWFPETSVHRAPFLSGASLAQSPVQGEVADERPAETRWRAVAEALVQMLLRMKSDGIAGGRRWMEGLNQLISYPPTGLAPFTGGDDLGFDDFAGALLHDVHVAVRAECLETEEARQMKSLLARMEEYVVDATRHLQPAYDWTSWPGAFGQASQMAAAKAGACRDPPFGGFGEGHRYLLFIGLPLALYVSDCPHLYQLVRRLRSLAQLEPPIAADMVRAALDHDGLPYSVLVYALVAALQALHAVRLPGQGAEGLQALAPRGGALLFRGMWVPREIDEHRAEFSWSFNSFSRSMEGVLSVLNFYACAEGSEAATLAKEDAHAFVLVTRLSARGSEWAFPVQLFAGGEWAFPANVEQEVVFPPFVRYVFEGSVELSTNLSKDVLDERVRDIQRRWDVSLADEAPALMRMLRGEAVDMKGFKAIGRPVSVTVRFVRTVEPAEPVRELFKAAAPGSSGSGALGRLLDFPKVEERMPPQETDWQEALALVDGTGVRSMSDWPADWGSPLKLSIVGTWSDFKPEEMWWWGGILVYPVVIGSNGWESFQLLVDGSWKSVIYPSDKDANVLQKGWTVCGPDSQGHGKNWMIGRKGVERTIPGSRVLVMVSFDAEGCVKRKGVRWRPA